MNNCLVQKLKEAVDNAELLKLGEIRIKTCSTPNTGLSGYLRAYLVFNTSGEISIVSGSGDFDNNHARTKTYTSGAACEFTTTASGDVISIDNKYAITSLILRYSKNKQNVEFSIDDLLYSSNLQALDVAQDYSLDHKVSGKLGILANKISLTQLKIDNSLIEGHTSDLSGLTGLQVLTLGNAPVSGDIASLGSLKGLTTLGCAGTRITGTFESLLEEMVANGRLSGSFDGYFGHANITLLGAPIAESHLYVTFNSATSIYVGTSAGASNIATGTYSGGSWSWA